MHKSITLRPVSGDDEGFLFGLYRSVHEQTFASLNLPEEQKTSLLRMQFNAQRQQYRSQYPDAHFDRILEDGVAIGTLYAMRGPEEFVLIDIMLLAEHRNTGIGAKLVKKLIREANAAKKPLQAHVLKTNPAWRLWRRLGFEIVADDGVYLQIRVSAG